MIHAKTQTDDWVYEIDFDATPWFEQASPQEILDLYHTNWKEDDPADRVVEWFDGRGIEPEIEAMFHHIRQCAGTPAQTSYECSVDACDALDWLNQNRPRWRKAGLRGRAMTPAPKICGRCGATSTGGVWCPNGCGRV